MKRLYYYMLIALLSLCSSSLWAGNLREDSLTQAISLAPTNHEKINLMSELWSEYSSYDRQKALELSYQALKLAESQTDLIFTHNLIGLSYRMNEQPDSAMHYFQLSYSMAEDESDSLYMAKTMNNIGATYFDLGDYESGLEFLTKAAKIYELLKDYKWAATNYSNLGGLHALLGNEDEAIKYCMIGLRLSKQSGDRQVESQCYISLGAIEMNRKNFDKGKELFFKAIEIMEASGNLEEIQAAYHNLAASFEQEGKYTVSEIYYLKALEYADSLQNATDYRDTYKGLAMVNEKMSKYSRALDYYKLYISWSDSVQEQNNMQLIHEMKERFNSEQTEKENELLQKENRIKNLQNLESTAKLNQSRILIASTVIGLLLLIGLAFVLFNRNRIKQRANIELQVAHDIIQEKNDDITASIEYASKIQEALLPTKDNQNLFKDSFFILRPKDIVSGDFLWYSEVKGKIVFAAADCTGHGVPGAFMSMIGNTFLHQIVNEKQILNPADILNELRENVVKALSQQSGEDARKDGMDMAVCVLDKSTNVLEFSGANNPIYYVQDGEMKEIKGDKQPVGYMPERNNPFTSHRIDLSEGDALYIFSDGYADQFGGPKGKKFKYKRMRELLFKNYKENMAQQKNVMIEAFDSWKGDLEQIDDVCMIGVRV